MIKVPDVTKLDCAFGNISFLPKMDRIPEEFKRGKGTKWNKIVSGWFFQGLTKEEYNNLKPKKGIDKGKAIAALKAVLSSFEPKHEHKEAGAAYLMSEWFE